MFLGIVLPLFLYISHRVIDPSLVQHVLSLLTLEYLNAEIYNSFSFAVNFNSCISWHIFEELDGLK